MKQLNTSLKHNLIVGLLLALWIFVFAFIIRPFDDGTLNFRTWFLMSIGFSVTALICYGILAIVQRRLYQKISKWNTGLEVASLIFFYLIYFIAVYGYYKSPILNGGYRFAEFFTIIFIKVVLVLTPVIVLARRYLLKLIPVKEDLLVIKGENKLDILKIKTSDLVCISNAQNYVEIFYTENDQLRSKLIRTSLKKLQDDFAFLVQIHRSHLINPLHFKSWRDQNTIVLTQIELPVSKSFKENLLAF
jgi:hypothetical protein